jgi:prepilin-type N-terminal cleavage/methylation domain-containing protein
MHNQKGITLVECLTVIVIIVILAATAWIVLGPQLKRNAMETRVKSDLRQIAAAIAAYQADHNGYLPLSMKSLPDTVPKVFPDWPQYSHLSLGEAVHQARYILTYNHSVRSKSCFNFSHPFDSSTHAIVKADFIRRDGGMRTVKSFSAPGEYEERQAHTHLVLGVRLDGSVIWTPFFDDWEREVATVAGQTCH